MVNPNESTFATYSEPITVTLEDIIEATADFKRRFPVEPIDRFEFRFPVPEFEPPKPDLLRIYGMSWLSIPRPMTRLMLDLVGDEPTTLERITQSLALAGFWDAGVIE